MNPRELKGQSIAEKNNQIKRLDGNHYEVKSQSRGIIHNVISTEFGWNCSCEDHSFRKICCKHIHAVEISAKLRKAVKESVVLDVVDVSCCQYCKSENLKKAGIRKNKTHSIQLYQCKDCKKRFSTNLGFEKMHASPQVITSI